MVVQMPVSLLLDPGLTASAKLVWMVLSLGPATPALLDVRSGLDRKTVTKGLTRLGAAGWCSAASGKPAAALDRAPSDPRMVMPLDLLADRGVGVLGKILYGILQATPEFQDPTGRFTYASLSGLAHTTPRTAKGAVSQLVRAGWLMVAQVNQLAPVRFALTSPTAASSKAEVVRAQQRLDEAPFFGEQLMREFLSLLVASDEFEDNAAPGFLVNPWTDERMELDRFYPPGVAFEFNGPHHYGATDRVSAVEAARQRGRDYMKLGICTTRGISLVVIHPEDLSLEGMQQKLGHLLPLRDLKGHEPLIAHLEKVSRRYRRSAGRGPKQAPGTRRRRVTGAQPAQQGDV